MEQWSKASPAAAFVMCHPAQALHCATLLTSSSSGGEREAFSHGLSNLFLWWVAAGLFDWTAGIGGPTQKDVGPSIAVCDFVPPVWVLCVVCACGRDREKKTRKVWSLKSGGTEFVSAHGQRSECVRVRVEFACSCRVMFKGKRQLGLKIRLCLNYAASLLGADFLEQESWPRAVLQ